MKVSVELMIERPIQEVWEVMGNQFGHVAKWSSNFHSSEPGGEPKFGGIPFSQRNTFTDRGETIQVLEAFDAENFTFSYRITKGLPPVADMAKSTWYLKQVDAGKTIAAMDYYMDPKPTVPGEMLEKIEKGLGMSALALVEELKFYLENGEPHPRKLESTQKTSN